jgi:hypothetical protein
VDETIEIHCALVNLQEALIIQIFTIRAVAAEDHLHRLIEPRDALLKTVQVKSILDVVDFYFDEELMAFQVAEPLDPATVRATLRIKHF